MDIPIRCTSAEDLLNSITGWAEFIQSQAIKQFGNSIQIISRTGSIKASLLLDNDTGVFGLKSRYASLTFTQPAGDLGVVRLDWQHKFPDRLVIKAEPKVSKLPDRFQMLGQIVGVMLTAAMAYFMIPLFRAAWVSSDYRDIVLVILGGALAAAALIGGGYAGFLFLGKKLEGLFLAQRVLQCRQFTDDKLRPFLETAVRARGPVDQAL